MRGSVDDLDVNPQKLDPTVAKRNEQLTKLLVAIGGLNLRDFAGNTIDAFDGARVYLMTMYSSSAGKSGGEFFIDAIVADTEGTA